jgi:hypothetical protein
MLRNNPIQRIVLFLPCFNFRYREIMTSREKKKISIGKPPEGVSPKGFSFLSHVTQKHHKWVSYNI